eukprot:COSAG05_NODE_417_length_10026_cov_189.415634_6_plen_1546_part_00
MIPNVNLLADLSARYLSGRYPGTFVPAASLLALPTPRGNVCPPPQIQGLVAVLGTVSDSTLTAAFRHVALKAVGKSIPTDELEDLLVASSIGASEKDAFLAGCEFLLKQAQRPGVTVDKLEGRLSPLGFAASHLAALQSTLTWINQAEDTSAASPTDATGPNGVSTATHLPGGNGQELTPMQMARQQLGLGSDSDENDADQDEDEDDEGDDEHYFHSGRNTISEVDLKARLSLLTEDRLKVILRCTAQHCAGAIFDAATCDALDHVLGDSGFKSNQAPQVLKVFSESIRTRADGHTQEALYTLGQGHAALIRSASKWFDKRKPASPDDTQLQDLLGSDIAGWLEVSDWAGNGKVTASTKWSKKYLKISRFGLEVFPSATDAAEGIRGPEYSVVPKSLLEPSKRGIDALVPKSVKVERPFAFCMKITDTNKVQGAPLPKVLVLDACDANTYGKWTNTITAVLETDKQETTGRVVVTTVQSFDSSPPQATVTATVPTEPACSDTPSTVKAADEPAAPPSEIAPRVDLQTEALAADEETGEDGMETWSKTNHADDDATAVPPPRRADLENLGWERDLRNTFVTYKFSILNDNGQRCEFKIRYSVAEAKHKDLKQNVFPKCFRDDDQPKFPPKNSLKDMVNNDGNVAARGVALYSYFSHIFCDLMVRELPAWRWIFNPDEDEEGEPPEDPTTVGSAEGLLDMEILDGKKATWVKKWISLNHGILSIKDDEEALHYLSQVPLEACTVSLLSRKKSPHAFSIDVIHKDEKSQVKGKSIRKLVLDPKTEEHKKKWAVALADTMWAHGGIEHSGSVRLECGAQKKSLRSFEPKFLQISRSACTLEMFQPQKLDAAEATITGDGGAIVAIPLRKIAVRDPKSARKGLDSLFRIDVAAESNKIAATASVNTAASDDLQSSWRQEMDIESLHRDTKFIIDAGTDEAKCSWMDKLRRAREAAELEEYLKTVQFAHLRDTGTFQRFRESLDGQSVQTKMAQVLEAVQLDPDNAPLQDLLSQVSKDLSHLQVGGSLATKVAFKNDEIERIVLCEGGCHIHCKFGEGPLGIVFEGDNGKDVHISNISPNSQAALMENLCQGLQLTQVQDHSVVHMSDLDEVVGVIVNSSRPLHLCFWRASTVTCTFYDLEPTGLTFRPAPSRNVIQVAQVQKDSEAWDAVQLRRGLIVKACETYDGEEYSCKSSTPVEMLALIDTPNRPLKIIFADPEFDGDDSAVQQTTGASTAAGSAAAGPTSLEAGDSKVAVLSEGQVLASLETFSCKVQLPSDEQPRAITLRTSKAGISIISTNGEELLEFFPVVSLLELRKGLQAESCEILAVARSIYTGANPEVDSKSAATWLKFCECKNPDAIIDGLQANGAGSSHPNPQLTRLQCHDPSVLRFFTANQGSRVAPLKEGLVELGSTAKMKRLKKGGRWKPLFLSLNEIFLSTHGVDNNSDAVAAMRVSAADRSTVKVENPLNAAQDNEADEVESCDESDGAAPPPSSSATNAAANTAEEIARVSSSSTPQIGPSCLEQGMSLKDVCEYHGVWVGKGIETAFLR